MAKKNKLKRFVRRKVLNVSQRFISLYEGRIDKRLCGCSLAKYVPSLYRQSMGATGSQSSPYRALKQIFAEEQFTEQDSFLDVGCGKGRVLAYLNSIGCPCPLTGVELNADVAAFTQAWAERFDNITIIHGNAFELDLNRYTVLFLGRPFEPETFYRFIHTLEANMQHPFTLLYWWDTQSGGYLENRPGWERTRRLMVGKKEGLSKYFFGGPQGFSHWEYTPSAAENE